jgi:hypothetical protein
MNNSRNPTLFCYKNIIMLCMITIPYASGPRRIKKEKASKAHYLPMKANCVV